MGKKPKAKASRPRKRGRPRRKLTKAEKQAKRRRTVQPRDETTPGDRKCAITAYGQVPSTIMEKLDGVWNRAFNRGRGAGPVISTSGIQNKSAIIQFAGLKSKDQTLLESSLTRLVSPYRKYAQLCIDPENHPWLVEYPKGSECKVHADNYTKGKHDLSLIVCLESAGDELLIHNYISHPRSDIDLERVQNKDTLGIRLKTGDFIIFRSLFVHSVPTIGARRRVIASQFYTP